MTIPDKLITAAAEAIRRAFVDGRDVYESDAVARAALAAAFAALPECDEAVTTIYYALEYGGERRVNAEYATAALARMAES